jgi:hypothetical protein
MLTGSNIQGFNINTTINRGKRKGSWLRNFATSQKVAVSIPDEVTGLFNWPNPSSRTTALGPAQSVTEMSTMDLPGGKGWLASKADNLTAICEPKLTAHLYLMPRTRMVEPYLHSSMFSWHSATRVGT